MDILDRISNLLGAREQRELTNYLGLNAVAFSEWKSGKSKSYRKYLIEISEFFNVSIDYLVYGKESYSNAEFSDNKQELLNLYDHMSELNQGKLIGYAQRLIEEQKENKVE